MRPERKLRAFFMSTGAAKYFFAGKNDFNALQIIIKGV